MLFLLLSIFYFIHIHFTVSQTLTIVGNTKHMYKNIFQAFESKFKPYATALVDVHITFHILVVFVFLHAGARRDGRWADRIQEQLAWVESNKIQSTRKVSKQCPSASINIKYHIKYHKVLPNAVLDHELAVKAAVAATATPFNTKLKKCVFTVRAS